MENKAKIVPITTGQRYQYFDKNGTELHEGDIIVHESGKEEKLYLTEHGELGTDATNPAWIESGRAFACDYGIYPLTISDLVDAVKKEIDEESDET